MLTLTTLLYYHYNPISSELIDEIITKHRLLCESLHLHGRVRISEEGYNGTLDGTCDAINQYISYMEHDADDYDVDKDAYKNIDNNDDVDVDVNDKDAYKNIDKNDVEKENLLSVVKGIHWKLGSTTVDRRIPTLSVKRSKEVVSLDLAPATNQLVREMKTGKHLTPQEFHNRIQYACRDDNNNNNNDDNNDDNDDDCNGDCNHDDNIKVNHHLKPNNNNNNNEKYILLDVRNSYETRIGRFQVNGIQTIDPFTRNYSEFTKFIDHNIYQLKNKSILTYCTGGVRCEKACQYLYYKGLENIYQLHGGIYAYMNIFPTGGFFKGKNFVYDPRLAINYPNINPLNNIIIGKCCQCQILYDDYTKQYRCNLCRILILVCDNNQCCNDYKNEGILCDSCKSNR